VKAGDEKDVTVTFPEAYGAADLAGKEAVFEVKVHEVRAPKTAELDDEFAKGLGLESLEQLTGLVKDQLKAEHDGASRAKAKRNLLHRGSKRPRQYLWLDSGRWDGHFLGRS
jgi:trigger factor